jgi:hypothetical protein
MAETACQTECPIGLFLSEDDLRRSRKSGLRERLVPADNLKTPDNQLPRTYPVRNKFLALATKVYNVPAP